MLPFDLVWSKLDNIFLMGMTLEDISNFCQLRDCCVRLGHSEAGFILVDAGGVDRSCNYARFLALNELRGLASPGEVLQRADLFQILGSSGTRQLNREDFKRELLALLQKVGLE